MSALSDLILSIEKPRRSKARWIYRGVSDKDYELIPKVGRCNFSVELERDAFEMFRRHGTAHLELDPADKWEWLALAQHHGLATRFLDWTYNLLTAVYFAVEDGSDRDAAVYSMPAPTIVKPADPEDDPLDFNEEVAIYSPYHFARRIAAQGGVLTIHADPEEPFQSRQIKKMIIPHSAKESIKGTLHDCGVNQGTLFPDLDGQAAFINWYLDL